MNGRSTGHIATLKDTYGFIAGDDGEEYFFHGGAMVQTTAKFNELTEGERVEFDGIEHPKGARAINVRTI